MSVRILRKCALHGPATDYSLPELFVVHADTTCPILHAETLTAKRDEPRARPVHGLFVPCGPSAIIGMVAALAVDAIKRLVWWTFAHIRKEVFVLAPASAYRNSSPTVPEISGGGLGETPSEHVLPNIVSLGLLSSCGIAVRSGTSACHIPAEAAAGLCIPASQSLASCSDLCAAFATADPHALPRLLYSTFFNDCKASKCLA